MPTIDNIAGCVLGTAVGDALGLPYEGLSPQRASRLLGPPTRHRLVFGRGMVSDDTEHCCMCAQAWIETQGDLPAMRDEFARRLKWWMLKLPAGVGWATARACARMWIGLREPGVFSAGNGPAMRAPLLGVLARDGQHMRELVRALTRLTHTDPKAEHGALAIALAARMAMETALPDPQLYRAQLAELLTGASATEMLTAIDAAIDSLSAHPTTLEFVESRGWRRGVSGYVLQTVPAAVRAWLANPRDYHKAVTDIVACGGDADTTGAIVGGLVGTAVGKAGIPAEWLGNICDWPGSVAWMEALALQVHESTLHLPRQHAPRLPFSAVVPRNMLFLMIVLGHGFRRLLPPY